MAVLYKMFSCQGGLNWIYGECTVKNVLLSRWFDLVIHGYGTLTYNGQIQGLKTMDPPRFSFGCVWINRNR